MNISLYLRKDIRISFFFLALTLSSCEKDELTQPVEVYFQFKLDREASVNATLTFQSGTMDIQSISFIGDRESGDDIGFVSDFGTIVHADLATGNSDPIIRFDIPQGNYTQIRLAIAPENATPDIILKGSYVRSLLEPPVPVQLEIDLPGQLNLTAKSPTGATDIVLRKESRATVEVFLNPARWIAGIPLPLFEAAELQNISGVPSILISQHFNPEIYATLPLLIEVSAEAVFK
jgi:hypothetical protein